VAPGLGLGQFEKLGSHAGAPGNRDGVQETWVDWKLSSHRIVSLTQIAVGWCCAARVPVSGRTRVATFIAAVSSHFWKGVTLAWVETNGQAAVLMSRDGDPVALATIDATAQVINQFFWPQIVMGAGSSFMFVPLAAITVDPTPQEKMGYATSLIALARNVGAGIGISAFTAFVARREQFHQARLAAAMARAQSLDNRALRTPGLFGSTRRKFGVGGPSGAGVDLPSAIAAGVTAQLSRRLPRNGRSCCSLRCDSSAS
jgi:hypothetical protein